jgi:hypothetical protein
MTGTGAIDEWYSYAQYYDPTTGKVKLPDNLVIKGKKATKKQKAEAARKAGYYLGLLWRSYSGVAFAARAPWVVGRFC